MAPGFLPSIVRPLLRRPGLALARLATVAMIVGALAAVTAIVSATQLRPLPFPDPDRLVSIYSIANDTTDVTQATPLFPVEFAHLDARGPSIASVAAIWVADRAVAGGGEPDSVSGGRVTANFFEMLGAPITLGRTFTDDEMRQDAPLVVLGHGLWTRMFGADAGIVGRTIHIDRRPHTVIGVTGRGFEPVFTSTQFWTPLTFSDVTAVRASVGQTIGRLRPDASPAAATADLAPVTAAARQHLPDLVNGSSVGAIDLREARFGPRRNALLMLTAIVVGLGLLATANLTNLTLADLTARESDFALRSALGGSARAMTMAEITPCLALAILGSAAGLWLAAAAVPSMLALDPSLAAAGLSIAIDWRVVAASIGSSLAVMAAAVAVPSWRMARRDFHAALGSARTTAGHGWRAGAVLVGAQSAIALVLLSASALVVTAVHRNASRHPGFDSSHVVTGQLRLSENAYPTHGSRVRFLRAALDRLRSTPGVISAGTTLNLFTTGGGFTTNVTVEDAPRPDGGAYSTQFRRVSPGYFEAMKIRLVRGRTFEDTDTDTRPAVAIVSESFARQYWPNANPIGRRIKRGAATSPWLEIVGVVADTRDAGLTQDTGPVLYSCYYQGSTTATPAGLVVRTAGDARTMIALMKQAIWSVDPAQPLSSVVILDDFLAASLGPQKFRAWLVGLCSLFGAVLAIIGIYGVTSRSVAERTREVGIRIALGGRPSAVWWRLVGASMRAVLGGVAAGAILSRAVDAGILRLLPELGSSQWTFRIGAAAVMSIASIAAAMIAARPAASVDPALALRGD
jgi:putative ABC transport system permease protein